MQNLKKKNDIQLLHQSIFHAICALERMCIQHNTAMIREFALYKMFQQWNIIMTNTSFISFHSLPGSLSSISFTNFSHWINWCIVTMVYTQTQPHLNCGILVRVEEWKMILLITSQNWFVWFGLVPFVICDLYMWWV